jgi:hypothetical protein
MSTVCRRRSNRLVGIVNGVREEPLSPFERRFRRWLAAGAFTARHWRGMLLSLYAATLALFALLTWAGYAHRARGWGTLFELFFGFFAVVTLMRFPRRLVASMRRVSRERRRMRASGMSSGDVIDVDAYEVPPERRELR